MNEAVSPGPVSILAVPAWEKGRGGGHLNRSITVVRSIRSAGGGAWLYLPPAALRDDDGGVSGLPARNFTDLLVGEEELTLRPWSLIVLDRFRCPPEELRRWIALGPVLGIDEGLSRSGCDFLIDLLPGLSYKRGIFPGEEAPNLLAPSLLPLPRRRRPSFFTAVPSGTISAGSAVPPSAPRVLISFGAEDPADLSVEAALALAGRFSLTVVLGERRRNNGEDRKTLEKMGCRVILSPAFPNGEPLKETLADYDAALTHFGLTAFEALRARTPALLLNPGPYHEKLSRRAGLVSAGQGRRGLANLLPLLLDSRKLAEQSERAARRWGLEGEDRDRTNGSPKASQDLAALLMESSPRVHRFCPLCGGAADPARPHRVLGRFPGRTYRRCSCGALYMDRLSPPPVEYNRDYFFSAYQKQYGKTYLEDFPQLKKTGARRLECIRALLARENAGKNAPARRPPKPRLLDIGCAYGPFLAAAREGGFDPQGQDPVLEAVTYVRETLGLKARRGFFPRDLPGDLSLSPPGRGGKGPQFDAVTLWYVIEHFEEPGEALKALNGLLKTGGVLAFSTPSFAGVSRRKSPQAFLEKSPGDHWTIWDPPGCAGILARYGFTVKKLVFTGHHPERFPLAGPLLKPGPDSASPRRGAAYRLLTILSGLFRLGDTFEVYALKTRDLSAEDPVKKAGGVRREVSMGGIHD